MISWCNVHFDFFFSMIRQKNYAITFLKEIRDYYLKKDLSEFNVLFIKTS